MAVRYNYSVVNPSLSYFNAFFHSLDYHSPILMSSENLYLEKKKMLR